MQLNTWLIIISIILFYIIVKKIINLGKPFNEEQFIEKYNNYKKLEEKMNLEKITQNIQSITSYFIGLNNI